MSYLSEQYFEECFLRIRCILKHVGEAERDGLPNSLEHLQNIEQDARALEDMFANDSTTQPVHL